MNAVKVDSAKRIRLTLLTPGDYYEPEVRGEDAEEITLRDFLMSQGLLRSWRGIWQAMICAAAGLAVAIPMHAGYNYLVSRVNSIVLDMERAATEIVKIVTESNGSKAA